MPHVPPWYASISATLVTAAVAATATVLTARWNRFQHLADRRADQVERRAYEAQLREEGELRERRVAIRMAWAAHYQRIDELLVTATAVAHEAQRQRFHNDAPEAAELVRLRKSAVQYAAFAPGGLPAALAEVAQALDEVHRHLLPAEAELQTIGAAGDLPVRFQPLFARAGEQTRAADRLTTALQAVARVLQREWGVDN